jgi:hypothetical protein
MIRISIQKSTGKIIEMQSGGETEDQELASTRLEALKQNAINSGFVESDIEVKWISEQDYAEIEEAQKEPLSYYEARKLAYPSVADQLDTIFHSGLDAWKAKIQAIKTAHPKDI